LIFPRYIYSF